MFAWNQFSFLDVQKNRCIFRYKSMESVKSREIDKRNEFVIDFYRLIDTIDINQITFTDFYLFNRLINRYRFLSIDYSRLSDTVFMGCVGVSKNYAEGHRKVEQCINNKCVQERRWCSVKYTWRWVTHKRSFDSQNKTYIIACTQMLFFCFLFFVFLKTFFSFFSGALLISSIITVLPPSTIACKMM